MLPGSVALRAGRRKMNLVQGVLARSKIHAFRQQRLDRFRIEVFQRRENQAAKDPLRQAFGCRIDRGDPAKMDGNFFVVLDHFKIRMLHAHAILAETRFAENHESLPGRDHFLDVMQVEPAQHQRLAERVGRRFFQGRFEDFFPASKTNQPRFNDFAADEDRGFAFFARERAASWTWAQAQDDRR